MSDYIDMGVRLVLPDDIERTPDVIAWTAEVEHKLNEEARRMQEEILVFGMATAPAAPPLPPAS